MAKALFRLQYSADGMVMCTGYLVPNNVPVWILLPKSHGLFWWDAMIRWLAVAFFIQIPIDIAFNMQQRLPHWYYITIQASCGPDMHLTSQTNVYVAVRPSPVLLVL